MIKIFKHSDSLVLEYQSDMGEAKWVDQALEENNEVTIARTFTFTAEQLLPSTDEDSLLDDSRTFFLGKREGAYFRINRKILNIKRDLLLSNDLSFSKKTFIAYKNISIFRKIDKLIDEPIIIGGALEGSIPIKDFEYLLESFPTTTEVQHYTHTRISRILKDYLGTITDAEKALQKYISKKRQPHQRSSMEAILPYEIEKYEFLLLTLRQMLSEADAYSETTWQRHITDLMLLVFPKYIKVIEKLPVRDSYSNSSRHTTRQIDMTLVDADGHIDIIEIKKPFINSILSTGRYRDNYVPKRELSGSIMQTEKYLFHLSKWGIEGERYLNNKYSSQLPSGMKLKITNPKALIILGRNEEFNDEQKFDFELIKRKYTNIIDIVTYDDLIRRLENIIKMLKLKST